MDCLIGIDALAVVCLVVWYCPDVCRLEEVSCLYFFFFSFFDGVEGDVYSNGVQVPVVVD